jgi:hypothetical protein
MTITCNALSIPYDEVASILLLYLQLLKFWVFFPVSSSAQGNCEEKEEFGFPSSFSWVQIKSLVFE